MDKSNYENLNIWQDGMKLVSQIYKLTANFPAEEIYGLTSQLRRAAVSVPVNIAEGHGRGTKKDFRQFLFISKGSLQEISTLIQVARSLNYIDTYAASQIQDDILSIIRRISTLIRNLVPPS